MAQKNREICVAIPIGGIVHLDYLKETLSLLQGSDALVYVGIDSKESLLSLDNYKQVREICDQYADKVLEFPPESYFRPGGIWKKIYTCWQASGATYVRGLGYDDLVPEGLILKQYEFMKVQPYLDATYTDCLILDEVNNTTKFQNTNLSGYNKIRQIGRNPFSFICWLIKFSSIDSVEFHQNLEKAAPGFEYFLHATLFEKKYSHFQTNEKTSPVRREHARTLSHLAAEGVFQEKRKNNKRNA